MASQLSVTPVDRPSPPSAPTRSSEFVVYLHETPSAQFDALVRHVREERIEFVPIVSGFQAHFGNTDIVRREEMLLERIQQVGARAIVLRCGHVLGEQSNATKNLRRFAFLSPLVPGGLRSCFVREGTVAIAIDSERQRTSHPGRILTLLGANRPWKEVLAEHRPTGVGQRILRAICFLFALFLLGYLFAFVLNRLIGWGWLSRSWNFDTLRPTSMRELLALVHPYNLDAVKVVGYNNGVHHFGHRYPGRTLVSTVKCDRIVRIDDHLIQVDCGTTLRKTLDFLAPAEQELYVIPNYSYVSMGTAFFVPIHGSAADYTTVAETITKVVLYDSHADRLVVTSRDEPTFQRYVYDMKSEILVLRLCLRVKPKSRYYLHEEVLTNPSSQTLLNALHDSTATNVEIRKSNAASDRVDLYKYYSDPEQTESDVLELPRDRLGRLWDNLEENAITSWLLHTLTRNLAWHVELFFTDEEFAKFWETHRDLPIRKLQLRYIHRDGFPNSPFRDHNCVSADMFMLRRHRATFEKYLSDNFEVVRSNPGKHSR